MKNIILLDNKDSNIRRIRDIIGYSKIKVENIIECSTELEAYNEIKCGNVDLLIVSITNKNKESVLLAKKVKKLKLKTNIIVINEKDDSSDIIEFLRLGIRDYLSSKFEDYELITSIKKLEEEYEEDIKERVYLIYEELRYLLIQDKLNIDIANNLNNILTKHSININYKVICTNINIENKINNEFLYFKDIKGHNVIIIKSSKTKCFIEDNLYGVGLGISKEYTDINFIGDALNEGINLREQNFFMNSFCTTTFNKNISIEENDIDKFIQLIGTMRVDISYNYIRKIITLTKRSEISPSSFLELYNKIYNKINETYIGLIETVYLEKLKNPFNYTNIDILGEEVSKLILEINKKLVNMQDTYRNRIKIEEAVRYINNNFKSNINMTFLSNYVSMNYTIFSLDFKEYTGKNFINYLKEVRLKEAKRLLDQTDMKINEISEAVGYDNDKHFMKTFKSLYCVTPSEYRKNIKAGRISKINISKY